MPQTAPPSTPSYLLTYWGEILDYDWDKEEIRSRPFDGTPPHARVTISPTGKACFEVRSQNDNDTWLAAEPFPDGKIHTSSHKRFPNTIQSIPDHRHPEISFFRVNGLYLTTNEEGETQFRETRGITWESYFLLNEIRFAQLCFILGSHWYSPGQDRLISSKEIVLEKDMSIKLGKINTKIPEILEFLGNNTSSKEIRFSHDQWQQDCIILYRPLIYYCSFGKEDGFKCLAISIESLRHYGKYDGDIAVLTERSSPQIAEEYRNITEESTLIPYLPLDSIDYMSARFDISSFNYFDNFQPILYLDTDVIIQNNINSILIDAIREKQKIFHVTKESSEPMEAPYYGRELFQEDETVKTFPSFGFTTGILMFRDKKSAEPALKQIRDVIILQGETFGARSHHMRCFDQPAANYVLHKLEQPDPEILTLNVCNFDMKQRHVSDNDLVEYAISIAAFPILHFAGGVGAYEWKLEAMVRYHNALKSRN
ncbi:hypothetical protein [Acetobacter conturbans]|uniref:Uncharacterized protein n=1 Tax=Acetobacter conturbans TaxID=1737472 RepID=A0ABX0JWX5_9PROT|nr:hypothetical protein [Acetobacter conturbans]NHN87051.1 hypothetical protein [Acetobacter conturbans]